MNPRIEINELRNQVEGNVALLIPSLNEGERLVDQIQALEDDTICYCIHAIRDGERVEDIIDPADIPEVGMDYRFIKEAVDTVVPTPKQYLE